MATRLRYVSFTTIKERLQSPEILRAHAYLRSENEFGRTCRTLVNSPYNRVPGNMGARIMEIGGGKRHIYVNTLYL